MDRTFVAVGGGGASWRRGSGLARGSVAWTGAAGLGALAAAALTAHRPLLGLVAIVLVGLLAVALVRPDDVTLLVVFLIFTNTPTVLMAKGVPQTAAAAVPLLLALPLFAGAVRGRRVVTNGALALMMVYLAVQLAAAAGVPDPHTAGLRLQTFVLEGLISYFLLTNVLRSKTMIRGCAWAIVVASAFLGFVTLFQDVTHTYDRTYLGFGQISADYFYGLVNQPRPEGPIGDPNYYAQVLLVGIGIGLPLAFGSKSRRARVAALLATALAAAGVVLTYSRGAVVAFAVALVLLVALRQVRLFHATIVVVALAALVATIPSYRARVLTLGSVSSANAQVGSADAPDTSVLQRSTEMHAAFLVAEHHPLFGVGPGQFPQYYQRYAAQAGGEVHDAVKYGANKGATPERVTHDLFLGVAANLGFAGLSIFASILGVTVAGLARARRRVLNADPELAVVVTGCLLSLAAYVTAGVFLELAYERYLWLLLALAAAATRLALSPREEP
jgi:putative inorganic carbon (hco3(-)) transporter